MPVVESFLTKPDVAKLAKFSMKTLERMVRKGRAPEALRVGSRGRGRVRFRASDVDLWLRLGCPDRAALEAEKARRAGLAVPA